MLNCNDWLHGGLRLKEVVDEVGGEGKPCDFVVGDCVISLFWPLSEGSECVDEGGCCTNCELSLSMAISLDCSKVDKS